MRTALALLVLGPLVLGGCGTSPQGDSTPTTEESSSTSEHGAWQGGAFKGVLAERPLETDTEGRYSVLVSDVEPDVMGTHEARLVFSIDSAGCSSGSSASLDDFTPGRGVAFKSPPNAAGLEATLPPPVSASTVTVECGGD